MRMQGSSSNQVVHNMETAASKANRIGTIAVLTACLLSGAACSRAQNSGPERDRWQQPDRVLDALGIKMGTVMADVGCGKGYFTLKFAERVGPSGKVYAEDIRDDVLADLRDSANQRGFKQIQTVLGAEDDPRLPLASLDAVLAMDTYHEWIQNDAMLDHIYAALKPGGLFGLIDGATEPGKSREDYHSMHRMPESMERTDVLRHNFHFLREEPGFTRPSDGKTYYFLIFQK
jgi:predicted methyltransferase